MTQPDDTDPVDDFDDTAGTGPDTGADPKAEAEKWKALARKHEQAAKANASAAKKLADIENRDKSETQKLTEERDALKVERDEARVDATRTRLGLRYRLEEADLDFLGSGTDEQMEARAKRLAERGVGKTPASGVDAGVRNDPPAGDMNALIRSRVRR